MRIALVNVFDNIGGAAKASLRLHRALLDNGIDSYFVVQKKELRDKTVLANTNFIFNIFSRIRWRVSLIPLYFYKRVKKLPFSSSFVPASSITKVINDLKPDIVHLQWIAGGMLAIEDISKINAPIVWTLHDCWPFTGGCHIIWDCNKYLSKCGNCPQLGSSFENDLSRWVFNRKKNSFAKVNDLYFIGVSSWITNIAKKSALLSNREIVTIPNLLNIDDFKFLDKQTCKTRLGLSTEKKILVFGAYGATDDVNKGYDFLLQALKEYKRYDLEILVFGNISDSKENICGFKTTYLGIVKAESDLNRIYAAGDVMIVPSIQESFGQTAIESMASGTPVVCFDTTGLKDIVDHLINGYRAVKFDVNDLVTGINWVLDNPSPHLLNKSARQKICSSFDKTLIISKYLNLYNSIINNKPIST